MRLGSIRQVGRTTGPQPTPASASVLNVLRGAGPGVRRGRWSPPYCDFCRELLSLLLVVQGLVFYGLSRRVEFIPPSKPLSEFPAAIGDWRMVREGAIEQDEKDVLRADDYLTRKYAASFGRSANLFVAYFQSQRAGQTPHSPKNCLPASGWTWSVADTIRVSIAGRGQPIEINRYIVSKDGERAVVLYWYQSRDRVVASEYRAAAFTAWDALRYNRTDTELVRVVAVDTQNGVEFIQAFFTKLQSR
jgi:EpsI family protein